MALGVLVSGGGNFYHLKGILEILFESLDIARFRVEPVSSGFFLSGRGGKLLIKGQQVGLLGEMDPGVLSCFGIKQGVFILELDLTKLLSRAGKRKFRKLPKYPPVTRDIALVVPEGITSQEIIQTVLSCGGELMDEVRFFDLYRGDQIPIGYKGLAYSLSYRASNRTLKDDEVTKVHNRISRGLKERLGARIRE